MASLWSAGLYSLTVRSHKEVNTIECDSRLGTLLVALRRREEGWQAIITLILPVFTTAYKYIAVGFDAVLEMR
jgi:hypothetical protein